MVVAGEVHMVAKKILKWDTYTKERARRAQESCVCLWIRESSEQLSFRSEYKTYLLYRVVVSARRRKSYSGERD